MMTPSQLDRFEAIAFELGLKGDALYAAYNAAQGKPVPPICNPREPKDPYKDAREYCLAIRKSVDEDRAAMTERGFHRSELIWEPLPAYFYPEWHTAHAVPLGVPGFAGQWRTP